MGLSTIADAIGLHKPLIITRNPYHDGEYLEGMHVVESVEDWVKAIEMICKLDGAETSVASVLTMQNCWNRMKDIMTNFK